MEAAAVDRLNPRLESVGYALVKQTKQNHKLAYKAYVAAMKRRDFALRVVIWDWFSQQKLVKLLLQLIRSEAPLEYEPERRFKT